jgi:hypothetical protein
MDKVTEKLTVFFEDPFWVGVFERVTDGRLAVCKVTFGAEPKDCELYAFLAQHYSRLRFSPAVAAAVRETARNPKRMRRDARRQVQETGMGTKAQQAWQRQQEQRKTERRTVGRERKEAEKQRKFEQKRLKRKEKHRGR